MLSIPCDRLFSASRWNLAVARSFVLIIVLCLQVLMLPCLIVSLQSAPPLATWAGLLDATALPRDLLWAHRTARVTVKPHGRPDFLLCVGWWVWSLAWDTEVRSSSLHRWTHIDWIYYVLSFIFYCICCGSLITGAATSEWTSPPLHLCVAGTAYDRGNFQPRALWSLICSLLFLYPHSCYGHSDWYMEVHQYCCWSDISHMLRSNFFSQSKSLSIQVHIYSYHQSHACPHIIPSVYASQLLLFFYVVS
jgi:hypothetical protein